MISLIVYYLLSACVVLFYGVGIHKSFSHNDTLSTSLLTCFKSLFSAGSTTAVTYLMMNWLLVPAHLEEFFPFLAALLFILFSTLTEIFIGIGIRQSPIDFSIPLLAVFLGLNEGVSIGYAVMISCLCIISFYVMLVVFHCVRQRVSFYTLEGGLKTYCVLLICLAVVMIAIYGVNVSWFYLYLGGGAK
ncbi:MAG: hypothetical protein IJ207_02270 [Treponema sp.]|uniref:hypothetical protein n=1 Tax=Treponema sp. TaxID=166 RepID=UPI0025F2A54E|nr:hypothetical protein [Treponema sp.]MBQ9281010.1 hypothetical protein [Treponema sp.]